MTPLHPPSRLMSFAAIAAEFGLASNHAARRLAVAGRFGPYWSLPRSGPSGGGQVLVPREAVEAAFAPKRDEAS